MTFNIIKLCYISLALLLAITSNATFANTSISLKTTEIDFYNQQEKRPTKVKFWYQGNTENCGAKICLSKSQNASKVAIISHGAFGSPRSMNWLGYALASQGWLVAGVAHYSESWVYGQETIDRSAVMRFWNRPQDVSFVIDSMSQKDLFNTSVENNKVLMLGHSSGGFTALAMAGAKVEHGKSEAYCMSKKGKLDKGCLYGRQDKSKTMSQEMLNKIGKLQEQMGDERIVAAIALDPALGHATNEKSLQNIKTPTLILGSVDNDFLPFTEHASYFAKHIDNASLVGIEQGAGHFIYLDQCDFDLKTNGVSLCEDRKGVDRKAIQKQILNHIFGFIYKNGLN
jgi:predicted dienelactone hydrolase